MCQKFIGLFKHLFYTLCDQVQHLVTCDECMKWIKHICGRKGDNK